MPELIDYLRPAVHRKLASLGFAADQKETSSAAFLKRVEQICNEACDEANFLIEKKLLESDRKREDLVSWTNSMLVKDFGSALENYKARLAAMGAVESGRVASKAALENFDVFEDLIQDRAEERKDHLAILPKSIRFARKRGLRAVNGSETPQPVRSENPKGPHNGPWTPYPWGLITKPSRPKPRGGSGG